MFYDEYTIMGFFEKKSEERSLKFMIFLYSTAKIFNQSLNVFLQRYYHLLTKMNLEFGSNT